MALNLPAPLTRLLSNFLDGRSAAIKLNDYIGIPIPLESGVPQGSILSPTLFTLYTHDIPAPAPHKNYLIYADDITQIVSTFSKSKEFMRRDTQRAIQTINDYEHKWKIKTNTMKFQVIPIARQNPPPIRINNTDIPYSREGKILGLTITPTGIRKHVLDRVNKARATLTKLKRFSTCSIKTKMRLYTTIVRPVLEYPPIPVHAASTTLLLKLQVVQNQALRWVYNIRYPVIVTNERLHIMSNLLPINIWLYNRATKVWNTLSALEDPLYEQLAETHQGLQGSHKWWRRSLHITSGLPPPEPLYRRLRANRNHQASDDESDDDPDDPD